MRTSIDATVAVVCIVIAAVAANWITKRLILRTFEAVTRRTPFAWDHVLVSHGVFTRLSHLVPAIVLQLLTRWFFPQHPGVIGVVDTLASLYLTFIVFFVFAAVVNAASQLLGKTRLAAALPLRGFAQALKLVAFLIALIFAISIMFGKTPLYILSGLGALTAVLLLVFRDPILGFVAGIQLSANNMVRVGDWIEMPSHDADGDVLDVTLTTVKVRNWDNTYTTVPTYDLISRSFKNWRGMQESGGRRIKRSIVVDIATVRFMDEGMRERFTRFQLLKPYLSERLQEVETWNQERRADLSEMVNGRRLTNIGCFRAYCFAYLRHHPGIRQDLMVLVRQLDSGPQGLPLEIYAFTKTTAWAEYEAVQADIFDHLFAVLPLFGLRVYQFPSAGEMVPGAVAQ